MTQWACTGPERGLELGCAGLARSRGVVVSHWKSRQVCLTVRQAKCDTKRDKRRLKFKAGPKMAS